MAGLSCGIACIKYILFAFNLLCAVRKTTLCNNFFGFVERKKTHMVNWKNNNDNITLYDKKNNNCCHDMS